MTPILCNRWLHRVGRGHVLAGHARRGRRGRRVASSMSIRNFYSRLSANPPQRLPYWFLGEFVLFFLYCAAPPVHYRRLRDQRPHGKVGHRRLPAFVPLVPSTAQHWLLHFPDLLALHSHRHVRLYIIYYFFFLLFLIFYLFRLSWVSFWINHEATSARVALGTHISHPSRIFSSIEGGQPIEAHLRPPFVYIVFQAIFRSIRECI